MKSILLLSFIFRATISDPTSSYQTAISTKRKIHQDPITIGVNTFIELVKKSNTFVDTSLFIEQALNYTCKSLLLLGPGKWGKSVNLDMLKTFLEIQVDDQGNEILPKEATNNYKLFANGEIISDDGSIERLQNPMLISKRKNLLEFYQGNFPVVYVSFKNVNGTLYSTVKKNLLRAVRNAFLSHKYMINVLRNITVHGDYAAQKSARQDLKFFQNVLHDEKLDKDSLSRSVQFLCEILQNHFNREAFVIFDDYDEPIVNLLKGSNFSANKLEQIFQILDSINDKTFQHNPHLHLGIVTGVFQLEPSSFPKWDTYALEEIPYKTSLITKYFGINEQDVQQLFDKYQISPLKSQNARKWYLGFTSTESDELFYSPYFVANFLKDKVIPHPHQPTVYDEFAIDLCKFNAEAREQIISLLNGQPVQIELVHRKISDTRLMTLMNKNIEGEDNFFPWYLFRVGYLSIHSLIISEQIAMYKYSPPDNIGEGFFAHYEPPVDEITVHVPNKQVALEMSTWMMAYYEQRYHIVENLLDNSSRQLLSFIDTLSWDLSSLERSFEELYHRCNYSSVLEDDMEDAVHDIFTCVVMKMQSISLFEIDAYYDKFMGADIVIANNQTTKGFLTQVSYTDQSIQDIMKSVETYVQEVFHKLPHLTNVELMAIKFSLDKTVKISTKVEEKIMQ